MEKYTFDFSSYMDILISDETRDRLRAFSEKYPKVKEELFEQTKNAMANTIYNEAHGREYINWVKDTLKYMNRYFK